MSLAKLTLAGGLAAVCLSACGIVAKPLAGTIHLNRAPGNHGQIDDPLTKHVDCLRANHVPFHEFVASGDRPAIQVGTVPTGPTVVFDATPGGAQYAQISGNAQAAEVVGSALLYPNRATDALLGTVEGCMALGVTG